MQRSSFTAHDGKTISYAVWDETEQPKGVLQIVHGMVEHIERYADFAAFMNRNGYIVAGDDHRAHGLTDSDALGKAGEGHLFEDTVLDLIRLTGILKEKYGLPVYVLGHSYGSFLTQRYLTKNTDDIAGCILCGSALQPPFMVGLGRMLAKGKLKKHRDDPGKLFAGMTFKQYDKKFKSEGVNAWISRDPETVGKYNTDPLCSFMCSYGFYYYMFDGLKLINNDDNKKIRKDLPLLIIAGTKDGVGSYGKLVKRLCEKYRRLGLTPKLKLYDGARHELLNEINRDEVYSDILNFISEGV